MARGTRQPAVAIAATGKGIGHRKQRVQPAQFLGHELDVPPIAWQKKIAAVMKATGSFDVLSRGADGELAALMPSLLDRAFRGEL